MQEVHPPHSAHTLKEFMIGLLMITIGLFIALSLEGLVGWFHHRHLVHEAEASLQAEIRSNAKDLSGKAEQLKKQQGVLKADVVLLNQYIKTHKMPKGNSMEVNFTISRFDNLSWTTAQSTGALSYMSYADAKEYAEIYMLQEAVDKAQEAAARDAILSIAGAMNGGENFDLSHDDAVLMKQRIEVLQGQLVLVNSLVGALDGTYKKFLAAHPQ